LWYNFEGLPRKLQELSQEHVRHEWRQNEVREDVMVHLIVLRQCAFGGRDQAQESAEQEGFHLKVSETRRCGSKL
jgi:hypothetical protein